MAQKPSASMSSDSDAMASSTTASSTTASASTAVPEQRDQAASKLVDRFSIWSGVAGLVPLPVVDVLAVGGLQLQMLRRLSQIYGVEFSENRGKALIAALAGCMIPATSGMGAASALKAVNRSAFCPRRWARPGWIKLRTVRARRTCAAVSALMMPSCAATSVYS